MRVAVRYNSALAQVLSIGVAPANPANAAQTPPVSGGNAATLALLDASGNAITGYDALTPAWDSSRRQIYYSGVFPAASFPLGYGYQAQWTFVVDGGSATAPEPRAVALTTFDVLACEIRPVVNQTDVRKVSPRLIDHGYTDGDTELAQFIEGAWDTIYLRVLGSLGDTPHSLVDSGALALPHKYLAASRALQEIGARDDAAFWDNQYESTLRSVLTLAKRDPGAMSGVPRSVGSASTVELYR